jgi:hypothetical protein
MLILPIDKGQRVTALKLSKNAKINMQAKF